MKSELLKAISERLENLKKEKKELAKELKRLKGNEGYLSRKGRSRILELNDMIEDIDAEIKSINQDYVSYEDLCKKVEELDQLISAEKKPQTKKTLKELYDEKIEILVETEEELEAYYIESKDKDENNEKNKNNNDDVTEKDKNKENSPKNNTDNKNKKKNHKIRRILYTVFGASLIVLVVSTIKQCGNSKKEIIETPTITVTPNTTNYITNGIESTPSIDLTPAVESSEILQSDDVEGIYAKSEEILDDMEYLSEIEHDFAGEELETLINIIRISNGELPLIDNEQQYSPNAINKYIEARCDLFANYPSSPQLDKIYNVNYADIVTDDIKLQKFAEKYDVLYNSIAEARNTKNWESFELNTQKLGEEMYNDWVLQGMYSGTNPYNFEPDQRLLALGISTERYSSYVMEYENANSKTVCTDVCIDYYSGETKKIPVEDIFNAIILGISNDATLAVNAPDGYQIISEEFYYDLNKELEYKSQYVYKNN